MPLPQDQADQIARMSSKAMGLTEAPPGAAAPTVPPPATPPAKKVPATTEAETASKKGAVKTEGDLGGEEPFFTIGEGEGSRKLSKKQIEGVLDRYNKNAHLSPITDFANTMLERGGTPEQLVSFFQQALSKSNEHNPTMGKADGFDDGSPPNQRGKSNVDASAQMKKWMADNELTEMPPGYSDMTREHAKLRSEMAQMQDMVSRVLDANRATGEASTATAQDAMQRQSLARQERLASNLNSVQQELGFPDDSAESFFDFASQRGYVMEDFQDVNLLRTIGKDFKNSMDEGRMAQLEDINKRRASYSGIVDQAPGVGGGDTAPKDAQFDRMVNRAYAK